MRAAGAVFALLLLAGCAAEDATTGGATATAEDSAAAGTDEATATEAGSEVAVEDCELAQGVTDTAIKLGVSTPLSGAAASIGADALAGQTAFVESVNAEGGVNGRTLELVSQDDEFNPERAATNAQFLVEQEQVFAVWGNVGSATASAALPIITDAGVPFVFPYTLGQDITDPLNPLAFAVTTTAFDQLKGLSDLMAEDPQYAEAQIAIMTINSPDGAQTTDGFLAGASADRVVSQLTYERGATSFQPQLLTAVDAGATVMYAGINDTQYSQMLTEASQLGLDIDIIGAAGTVTQTPFQLVPDLMEGRRAITFAAPDADGDGEQLQALAAAMEQYAPGQIPGSFAVHSWLGGLLIRDALERVGDCVTVDAFVAALEETEEFDTGGLSGPVTLSADDHRGNRSMALFEARGGAWTPYSEFVEVES